MAQIPNFIRKQYAVSRWASTALSRVRGGSNNLNSVEHIGSNTATATTESVRPLVPRARRLGLGLGERKLLQALADWLVVIGGALLILSLSERNYGAGAMIVSLTAVTALWVFFADAFDAYKLPVMQNRFQSVYTAAKVLLLTIVAYVLAAWFVGGFLPVIRPRISEALAVLMLAVPLLLVRALVSSMLNHAPLRRRAVVIGANQSGYEIVEAINSYAGNTYEFLGYFDDAPMPYSVNGQEVVPVARPVAELVKVAAETGIDQVILANPVQTDHLLHTISICHERGAQITPMFALYQDLAGRVPVSHLGDACYAALPGNVKSTTRTYLVVKRAIDLGLALLVSLVTAPVIPFVVLAIKLDSPGPVFFKQVRVGRGGKLFKIIKFRSMRADAEANTGAVWASDSDSRITRVGSFLRKSRFDELPQLWNVFVGDMSFVGPRPERPEFEEQLAREIPFYRARRAVRPGLTGWAQVRHGYGNTMLDALRKVEYDLYYIKNESLYLDLLIMLRTLEVLLKLRGT